MSGSEVRHDTEGKRFFVAVDGDEVTLSYRDVDEHTVDFTSTFTPPALRGRGLARVVVDAALDWARAEDKTVIPSCSYVAKVLEREEGRRS
jgi:predicted GNAT family acetyltransferase